ncbi:acyl-CoA dehydrogenase family protein [Rothia uropygioeca]|uniref:acyl-CoA dehydrogenase family protein n=1 Tax=Kocuria sp. 257 TaxID=2021970 RepID=UPI0010137E86|nr:acyl-CoA dehydrogenase family protein [Kocuria sp. 257]
MTTTTRTPDTTNLAGVEELKKRVIDIQGVISKHARESEENRRIAQPVIDALDEAEAFKLTIPRRYGGLELSIRNFVDINALIAEADTSTAWVTTLINVCCWVGGRYSQQAQDEIWGENPDAKVCGVLAPNGTSKRVDGGYVINGNWGFASGSQHADWTLLGIPMVDETGAQVDQGVAIVPIGELGYKDTWFVAGMSGTGSNTLIAEDVFVPDHRVLSVSEALKGETATEYKDEALYRTSFASVLALVLAGPLVGAARQGLNLVLASMAKGKGISYTFFDHAVDAGSTQIGIAEAASLIDTAELHIQRSANNLDEHARAGTQPSMLERSRVRMDTGYAAEKTREAMDKLLSIQGAGSFATANPLQRTWRDLNTASRHAIIGPGIATEIYGRALLGIKEPVSPLV